jgi:hypothetical protein
MRRSRSIAADGETESRVANYAHRPSSKYRGAQGLLLFQWGESKLPRSRFLLAYANGAAAEG